MTKQFWACALMTLLNSGVSAGFSLVFMLGQGRGDIFARYAAARSIALLLAVVIAIYVRSRDAIMFLGIAMTAVQLFDGVIGALNHDLQEMFGPLVLAVLNAFAVVWLLRQTRSTP
ncbi:MAG TPA: hypothetical protein VGP76_00830 [Planctomycetaceae bacterium]|jgi:hypothetical protein|nr:hypothetical protein [Planctomycetaceae bacterium]